MQYLKLMSFLIVLVINGCVVIVDQPKQSSSQLAVSSVWDKPVKFSAHDKFSLSPHYLEQVNQSHPEIKSVYHAYYQSIVTKLIQHGFQMNNDQADYNIVFGIALADDLNDELISKHFGVTPGLSTHNDSLKGSFMVYVEDSVSKQRIWRGTVQGFVQENYSSEQRKQRVGKVVSMVFEQFLNAG